MKNEEQAEPEAQLPELVQKVQPVQPSQQSQTAFLYEYLSLLQAEEKLKLSSLIDELRAGGIEYNSEQDHNQFYLHLTHHSNNYRTLTLQVVLGPFTTVLNIFSQTDPSFIHQLNCLYGCFGNVYLLEWGAEEEVAIKCIPIKQEERAESTMLRTIKEYTINKIASALRVGPRVIKIQEFDLITYEKCIEFCMEKCCLAEQYTLTEQDHEMLKLNLKKLHALGIVHCDIKYSNIVYSRSYKSPVFLDFGFSKVLSTGPGVPTKTKYVGSLESCCKEMLQLYLNKDFGMVDLYYNDAYSLKTSLKADPIRETGNDLSEIVKSCDPPSLSFHLAKIYYYLYRDQTFHATNEFLRTRRSDKKLKIMGYLDTLPPTQNLREFYFSFFEEEWRESVQFRDLVQLYGHSHRHHLQLGQNYQSADQPTTLPFYSQFMQKIFNCKLNLFQLDNDLINYTEICIGLSDFVSGKLGFQDEADFFIENAGLLVDNYFVRTRDFSLGWRICNIYFARIPEEKMGGAITESERLYSCFLFLAEHCLEAPITEWKSRMFRRAICEVMILKQTTVSALQQYLSKVLSLQCPLQRKLTLLHSLYRSLTYQIAVWGSLFCSSQPDRLKMQQLWEKLQVMFYRLTSEDQYYQNLIKLDHFLLKNLLRPDNRVGEIQAIQITFVKLRKEHARQRQEFLRFIKVIYLFENEFNEQCRLQIERCLSVSEKMIVLKPQYFILGMVYRRLRHTFRTKRIFTLIQSSAMTKDFIYDNPRMLSTFLEVHKVEANSLLDLKTVKPCMYLALVLQSYFQVKKGESTESAEPLNELIQEITQDAELVKILNKFSLENCAVKDKIEVYQRLINFFSRKLSECGSELSQKIKETYLDKLILEKYWLSGMYDQIIKHLTLKKTAKKEIRFESLQQDPTTFDFTLRAYFMLGRPEKVRSMVKSLEEQPYTEPRFIQRWILTTSFCFFFQYLLEKNIWQDFRDFLLALVDFMDIHPVTAFINSYTQSIRYSFSQKVDITLIDSGLQTIIFPKYQWKYPLLSFFHIEALGAMAKINDYLNRKELKLYLWRLTPFLPYLTSSQLKWFLQEYYHLLVKLSPKQRCRKAIFLKCRSLVNYKFSHHHFNYNLVHLQLVENEGLMQMILRKAHALDGFITEESTPILTNFKEKNIFSTSCMAKLRKYHRIAGNQTMKEILSNSEALLRLRLDR